MGKENNHNLFWSNFQQGPLYVQPNIGSEIQQFQAPPGEIHPQNAIFTRYQITSYSQLSTGKAFQVLILCFQSKKQQIPSDPLENRKFEDVELTPLAMMTPVTTGMSVM